MCVRKYVVEHCGSSSSANKHIYVRKQSGEQLAKRNHTEMLEACHVFLLLNLSFLISIWKMTGES